jgi:membrane protein DedA with SNARE-associated domain
MESPSYGFQPIPAYLSCKGVISVLSEKVFQLVSHYGYAGIFSLLFLGIVGLPVPDEILMTFAGYLVFKKKLIYLMTVLSAFLGSITGMTISFMIGRWLGSPFLRRYGKKIYFTPERLEKVDDWFNRFGKWTVSFGYFIPGVRHLTAICAGISNWSYRTFALFAGLGGLIWVLFFVTLGMFLGEHVHEIMKNYHRTVTTGLFMIAVGIGVWWLKKRSQNRNLN